MRPHLHLATALLLATASAAAAEKPTSVADHMSEVATGFCPAAISAAKTGPKTSADKAKLYASHGLQGEVPRTVLDALGPELSSLAASDTLAAGRSSDGAFLVALDPEDKVSPSCLVIAYEAPKDGALVKRIGDRMTERSGWRKVTPRQPSPNFTLALVRPAEGRPLHAAMIGAFPDLPRVAAMIAVEEISANAIIPEGF